MFLKKLIHNEQGIGLVAVVFVIVILSLFGMLISRYTVTTSMSSAEDYLWAQALYAAESGLKLRILEADDGGNWAGWTWQ